MNTTDTAAPVAWFYYEDDEFIRMYDSEEKAAAACEKFGGHWQAVYTRPAALATTPQTDGATAALTDEQIINIADSYSFTWDEGIIAFARALLAATHAPAMAETQTDAARYRWLRNEHFPTADNPPLAQVVWKAFDSRHSSDWANMIDGNDLDRAIDAAIAAASGGEQESQS